MPNLFFLAGNRATDRRNAQQTDLLLTFSGPSSSLHLSALSSLFLSFLHVSFLSPFFLAAFFFDSKKYRGPRFSCALVRRELSSDFGLALCQSTPPIPKREKRN